MPRNARSLMLNNFDGFGNYIYNNNNDKNVKTNGSSFEVNGAEKNKHVTVYSECNQQPKCYEQLHYVTPYTAINTTASESITDQPLPQPFVKADSYAHSVNGIHSEARNGIKNENLHQSKSATVDEETPSFNQHFQKRKTPETETRPSQKNKKKRLLSSIFTTLFII